MRHKDAKRGSKYNRTALNIRIFKKKDIIFFLTGVVFAAMPYVHPADYIYFRFAFYSFIGFWFGSRAGLLSTIPSAIVALIITPEWKNAGADEIEVYLAMVISSPLIAYTAGRIKQYSKVLMKLLPLLILFLFWLGYEVYRWLQTKPNFLKIPVICTLAVAAYFLFRYKQYLSYVISLMWLLILYYIFALVVYLPLAKFSPEINVFYAVLLSLFPADILMVFLGGAFLPQMEAVVKSYKLPKDLQ